MLVKGSIADRRHMAVPELVPVGSSAAPAITTSKIITTIGSKPGVDVRLVSKRISGAHALLINIDNNVYVCDLISRAGVLVNDKRVRFARLLFGDVVRFGRFRYRFSDEGVLRKSANAIEHGRTALLDGLDEPATIDSVAFIIGRREGAGLVIQDNLVSSAHAIIIRTPGKWLIADLHSRTGTTVNGRQIQVTSIRSGDTIRIGSSDLIFTEQEADASADGGMDSHAMVAAEDESIDLADDAIEAQPPVDEPEFATETIAAEEESDLALAAEASADEPIVPHEPPVELPGTVGLNELLKKQISAPLFDSPVKQVAQAPASALAPVNDEAPSPAEELALVPVGELQPLPVEEVAPRAAASRAAAQPTENKAASPRPENRPRRPSRPQRPLEPTVNNSRESQKLAPLPAAVADTRLPELAEVSRRHQMPTHRLAPTRPAAQNPAVRSAAGGPAAPRRRRRLALAGAVAAAIALVSGAAWYVVSHPHLVAQLW